MPANQKDTIYIDVDEEITAIIDKVRGSKQKIVALVLPKRATVLQSIVNMKLLKRSAEQAKKHVVLITSEAGLLPLAGTVGLHVAPSLQSRPVIPEGPAPMSVEKEGSVEDVDFDKESTAHKPVGQLAGPASFAAADEGVETIELDDEPDDEADASGKQAGAPAVKGTAAAAGAGAAAAWKPKKNKRLKIPDFNKFRMGLVLGVVLLIALIGFGYAAAVVLPKATVTLDTDSVNVPTNESVTLDPSADQADPESKVLPAKIATKDVTGSQQVMASGQENKGDKASGSVTLALTDCSEPEVDIPAGTGVSADGKTFITQSEATLESVQFGSKCSNDSMPNISSQSVDVVAMKPGADYNIQPTTFSVAGFSNVSGKSSDAMTGGTDNMVKVVSQSDIDTAKRKLTTQSSNTVKADLERQLRNDGYQAVEESMMSGDTKVTSSAQVGDVADTVTVTSTQTVTMYGVKQSDVKDFILANVRDKVDPSKQKILDDGSANASFAIASPAASGTLQANLSATTLAGPEINQTQMKSQIAGLKSNDAKKLITATPGISDVTVSYSPFWVSKIPKNTSKITIVVKKAAATANANNP